MTSVQSGSGRLDGGVSTSPVAPPPSSRSDSTPAKTPSVVNVGDGERAASVAAGSLLALLGLSRGTLPGLLCAGLGGAMVYRGVTGNCKTYEALHINTAMSTDEHAVEKDVAARGITVEQSFLIGRSPADLYAYWRNFENLPHIMSHLQSVRVIDEKKSHWVAKAPRIFGGEVEWDAEITRDDANSLIAWRSLPGSDIETVGQIRFTPALGERGTDVHVFMDYVPPAGKLGHWIATVFGQAPRRQMHEDLRNFKRIMEVGEIVTVEGQSHGDCSGK